MSNDRFKFRVYDEEINQYRKEGTIQLSMTGTPFIINGDMQVEDIDNVTIEFCTGFFDKNGKLIYEGDIVLIDKGDDCFEEREVSWYDFQSCLCFKMEIGKMTSYQRLGSVSSKNVEIIGNVHEMEVEK